MLRSAIVIVVLAQWLNYPAAGIPRLPDGKPRTSSSKPSASTIRPGSMASGIRTANDSVELELAPDTELLEDGCLENERSVQHMIGK